MTPAPVVHPRIAGLTEFLVRCMVAATVWFGGVFTTWLLITALSGQEPETLSLATFFNSDLFYVAIFIQAVLTAMESPIWQGRKVSWLTWGVLLMDTLVNAGGLWQWIKNLPETDLAAMINETLGVQVDITIALVIVLIIGAVLAYAPEAILRRA